MSRFFFVLLILIGRLVDADIGRLSPTTLHVINRLPNTPTPLTLRCQSKDNDIGRHILYNGQELKWSFYPNAFFTTLFFCHFYWGSKDTSFAVYDSRLANDCEKLSSGRDCYWEARIDGFYLSGDTKQWEKINNWP
ncbi:hypothetical protein U1Q18_030877 [Sarracenia purpurea var. burkii]